MITIAEAKKLSYRDTIYHVSLKGSDKQPIRARINGKLKTWKREPERFQLPVKHGLYTCFYITQDNANEWRV